MAGKANGRGDDDGYRELLMAVIALAVDDYRRAVAKGNAAVVAEVERFLEGESWIFDFLDVDPSAILQRLRRDPRRRRRGDGPLRTLAIGRGAGGNDDRR